MVVLIIIQARMASARLPGKILMNLEDKPILEHIIDFLRFSKLNDKIIVATTRELEDDKIQDICIKLNIDCFRGSEKDVLSRYYECAKLFKGDIIVRITADNPLIDPTLVDNIIRVCKDDNYDYASNMLYQTYPLGYLVEVMTFSTLKKIHYNQHDPLSREHVTHHIRENPHLYHVKEIKTPSSLARPKWRLTLDYPEDFKLISEIFSKLYKPNSYIPYESVVNYLDKNKHLLKINEFYNR